ncbi:adenosylcobinamide-phosphate synthase CbiB [Ornithinimicrobium panacihumi]|uniref:adenosylcobinamide-phosphate synthase CbiB n=1 Tax=Ornithinimicrobium panacihumi TaxID=2008449 RepID=UPI003F8BED3E
MDGALAMRGGVSRWWGGLGPRCLGVAVGLLLDRTLGEPPDRWHPVAWFGSAMGHLERRGYADSRTSGLRHAAAGVALGAAAGLALRPLGVAGVSTAVAVASAGRMLRHTSAEIEELLVTGDLEASRARLPWLVGRDPSALDASGIAAAVVESLAENTVDAVVAPAWWGVVAGAPGVLAHRAVNTMDAMVGHRSERYARFGTAAARLDDVMAWAPARTFAALVAIGAAGRARDVLGTVRRDAPAHPSPNSGVAEAAVAGALGVELGGPLRYGERQEERPRLGEGPRPGAEDIRRARALVDRVELMIVAGCVALWGAQRTTRARSTR